MLRFLSNHEEEFTSVTIATLVALMQLTGNLAAELVNILVLSTRPDLMHCLEHFVAFHTLT